MKVVHEKCQQWDVTRKLLTNTLRQKYIYMKVEYLSLNNYKNLIAYSKLSIGTHKIRKAN